VCRATFELTRAMRHEFRFTRHRRFESVSGHYRCATFVNADKKETSAGENGSDIGRTCAAGPLTIVRFPRRGLLNTWRAFAFVLTRQALLRRHVFRSE
jgi:hypothetical protein